MAIPVQDPWNKAPTGEQDRVRKVSANFQEFEQGMGPEFRERLERWYRLYRGFRKYRNAWESAGPNDRDQVLLEEGKKTWGSNLHIPYAFAIVELMAARAISHRPEMQYLARREEWEDNVELVRLTMEAQSQQVDIDLDFEEVLRDGLTYGIGIAKSYWRKEYAQRRRAKKRLFVPNSFKLGQRETYCSFDDPDFDRVDPRDFIWDPMGDSTTRGRGRRCGWAIHRVWLSHDEVMARVSQGVWATEGAKLLTEEHLSTMGGRSRYDETYQEFQTASGFSSYQSVQPSAEIHEVWEWHDGTQVLTVLDGSVLVQDAENPCVGELPFPVYRPTKVGGQMVGIGEIEPIESLNRELDALRSMQLDAGIIAMCAGYAYDESAVDEDDLVFGPAAAIPIRNARPSDAIYPLPKPDLPRGTFEMTSQIAADIERISGYTDQLADQEGRAIGTATEAQFVQAAISRRVARKSRRFETEVIRHNARIWLALNQRMILESRTYGPQHPASEDPVQLANTKRHTWFEVGPGELQGEFEIIPEGGSMSAENTAQKRQDALQLLQSLQGNPHVDQTKPLLYFLRLFDVEQPQSWLQQKEPPISPEALNLLQGAGVDPDLIAWAVERSQQQDPRLPDPEAAPEQAQQAPPTEEAA